MSVGSLRKMNIDGIDFLVIADADIDKKTGVLTEGIATSGRPMIKKTFQIRETTGFKLEYTKENEVLLTSFADGAQDLQINYQDQNGADFYCTGQINIESTSTMNGEITIKVIPTTAWV